MNTNKIIRKYFLQVFSYFIFINFSFSQPNITSNIIDVSCYSNNNGLINLTVSGGQSPYFYHWDNLATTQNLTNLSVGSYIVTVYDSSGLIPCQMNWSFVNTGSNHTVVIYSTAPSINSLPLSNGDYIGVFYTIPPSMLTCGGYTIWQGGNSSVAAWGDDYYSAEKDGFSQNEAFTWKVWHKINSNEGVVVDMTATYMSTFWNLGFYTGNGVSGIDSLYGTFSLAASVTDTFTINQPSPITVNGVVTNPNCYNSSDGSITISSFGGVSPYSYQWSNGLTTQDANNLNIGIYIVSVTDNNLCTKTAVFSLTSPGQINLSSLEINNLCNGSSEGCIYISVTGGISPYFYFWSNNCTDQNLIDIASGIYSVTVSDAYNCSIVSDFEVDEPDSFNLQIEITDATCFGCNDGSAIIQVIGGTSPYLFHWNNGETSSINNSLHAGNYYVTITDLNNCDTIITFAIMQPDDCENITNNSVIDFEISPNPIFDNSTITFFLPKFAFVEIFIVNNSGRRILNLQKGFLFEGKHKLQFNSYNIKSGIYYCILQSNSIFLSKEIIVFH